MYIGGGAARRRRLRSIPGQRVRPTSGWVRQALFNVLRGVVEDAMFVDLFAGTGSVGLEALSHGARHVYFVEHDAQALPVLRANIQHCAMTAQTTVVVGTLPQALGKLVRHGPMDLLFLDPPYASDLGEHTLTAAGELPLLAPQGVVIWQHATRRTAPGQIPGLSLWQSRRYGDTQLSFYRLSHQGGLAVGDGRAVDAAVQEHKAHV
jgi:16S rRNA (guanine966-N2)-methyltransferase